MVKNPQKQKQKTIFPFLKQKQDIISEKQKPRTKMVTLENQIIIHNPNKQFFFSLQQYHYFLEQKKIQKQWKENFTIDGLFSFILPQHHSIHWRRTHPTLFLVLLSCISVVYMQRAGDVTEEVCHVDRMVCLSDWTVKMGF